LRSACEPPDSLWEALFIQMILADDRAVRATFIAGQEAYAPNRAMRRHHLEKRGQLPPAVP